MKQKNICDPCYQNDSSVVKIEFLVVLLIYTFSNLLWWLKFWNWTILSEVDLWGIEKYEMEKWAFRMWVYQWVNCQLCQILSKLHHLCFRFWSKAFTVHLKHIDNNDFAKISKLQKIPTTSTFSRTSIWGLAQKRLVLKEWITCYE